MRTQIGTANNRNERNGYRVKKDGIKKTIIGQGQENEEVRIDVKGKV
jgi:hypothetical protein